MKLTQEKYNSITKIIGKDFQKRPVKIGSIIYSASSSKGTISSKDKQMKSNLPLSEIGRFLKKSWYAIDSNANLRC